MSTELLIHYDEHGGAHAIPFEEFDHDDVLLTSDNSNSSEESSEQTESSRSIIQFNEQDIILGSKPSVVDQDFHNYIHSSRVGHPARTPKSKK